MPDSVLRKYLKEQGKTRITKIIEEYYDFEKNNSIGDSEIRLLCKEFFGNDTIVLMNAIWLECFIIAYKWNVPREESIKKYEFTGDTKGNLKRIRAIRDFGDVKAGDLGGWIESEDNLSHDGDCWVGEYARVSGKAWVSGDARVFGAAQVFGYAQVFGNARVFGNAWVGDDAMVYDDARVFGKARVSGNTVIN